MGQVGQDGLPVDSLLTNKNAVSVVCVGSDRSAVILYCWFSILFVSCDVFPMEE